MSEKESMSRREELSDLFRRLKKKCTWKYLLGTERPEEEAERIRESELVTFEQPFACLPLPPIQFWVDFALLAILGGLLGLLCLGYIKSIDSLVAQWSPVAPDRCPYSKDEIAALVNQLRDNVYFSAFPNATLDPTLGQRLQVIQALRNLSNPSAFNNSLFANFTGECKYFPYTPNSLTWASGQPWWIAVGAGVGLVEGALKAFFNAASYPGLPDEMWAPHPEGYEAFQIGFLAIISQFGAASVGPEMGLGAISGFAAYVYHKIFSFLRLPMGNSQLYIVMGLGACLSPILPSPLITMMLVIELTRHFTTYQKVKDATNWGGYSRMHVLFLLAVSTTCSYATYHAIEPEVYLSPIPNSVVSYYSSAIQDQYDWAVGILIGIGGGILAQAYFLVGVITTVIFKILETLLDKIHRRLRLFLCCFIAGILYGLFNFLFPLVYGSGNLVLDSIVILGPILPSGLLVSSLFMKMVSYWVCVKGGLVGGAIFPLIAIGMMYGQLITLWTHYNPVVCLSAAFMSVIAGVTPLPYFAIMLTYVAFSVGPQGLFPITTSVFTSYVICTGLGLPQLITGQFTKMQEKKAAKEKNANSSESREDGAEEMTVKETV